MRPIPDSISVDICPDKPDPANEKQTTTISEYCY